MRHLKYLSIATLSSVALLVGGCGGDSDDAPLVKPRADYTLFVKAQIATTSEVTDPVTINGVRFKDRDRNDPQAYDDVLSP